MRFQPPSDRLQGDQGAVVAEFALILPFLVSFVLGIIEFGNAYRQENLLEVGVMTAARTNTQLANAVDTRPDYEMLQSISATLSTMKGVTLTKVVVWKANSAGTPPANCLSVPVSPTSKSVKGVADSCNVYSQAQVNSSLPAEGFGRPKGSIACLSSNWDANWCPLKRINADGFGDYLGVYIELSYQPITKAFFTSNVKLSQQVIYRLEPPYIGGLTQ